MTKMRNARQHTIWFFGIEFIESEQRDSSGIVVTGDLRHEESDDCIYSDEADHRDETELAKNTTRSLSHPTSQQISPCHR
jgi:hypothetical protein